jgi:hypothetical protein
LKHRVVCLLCFHEMPRLKLVVIINSPKVHIAFSANASQPLNRDERCIRLCAQRATLARRIASTLGEQGRHCMT